MMSESLRIPSKDEITFSLFLPPKIASAVRLYGDVTIFDASASFLSLPAPSTFIYFLITEGAVKKLVF